MKPPSHRSAPSLDDAWTLNSRNRLWSMTFGHSESRHRPGAQSDDDKPENFVQREVWKKVTPTSIVPRRWQAGMSLNAILTSMLVAWISRPR